MLRITHINEPNSPTLKLEGKLIQPWVAEVEKTWRSLRKTAKEPKLIVDMNAVTMIDEDGKRLLEKMYELGTELSAEGAFLQHVLRQVKEKSAKRKPSR